MLIVQVYCVLMVPLHFGKFVSKSLDGKYACMISYYDINREPKCDVMPGFKQTLALFTFSYDTSDSVYIYV